MSKSSKKPGAILLFLTLHILLMLCWIVFFIWSGWVLFGKWIPIYLIVGAAFWTLGFSHWQPSTGRPLFVAGGLALLDFFVVLVSFSPEIPTGPPALRLITGIGFSTLFSFGAGSLMALGLGWTRRL